MLHVVFVYMNTFDNEASNYMLYQARCDTCSLNWLIFHEIQVRAVLVYCLY